MVGHLVVLMTWGTNSKLKGTRSLSVINHVTSYTAVFSAIFFEVAGMYTFN